MELLLTNIIYVSYRLFVSGVIVKFLKEFFSYYVSVLIMAQLSFAYDTLVFGYYFEAKELPNVIDYLVSDCYYTIRVLAAWWLIKQTWDLIGNYWVSIFLVAELTFLFDYIIFEDLFK